MAGINSISLRLIRVSVVFFPLAAATAEDSVSFERRQLTDRYYCDGVTVGDIDSDGHPDIIAGPYWYAGPLFEKAHAFYEPVPLPPEDSPSNSMFSFVRDFNADGHLDILVLGRVHKHEAAWYENPGEPGVLWNRHFGFERIRGESPMMANLLGDKTPHLLTHWNGRWGTVAPQAGRPYLPWQFHPVGDEQDWPQFYHGEGFGDLNQDGRLDILINDGWYEQPPNSTNSWRFHRGRFSLRRGGAQMFVDDVDGDGDADVISALHGHEWGLAWFEQLSTEQRDTKTDRQIGRAWFREHLIMDDRSREPEFGVAFSQVHALEFADIDGDGHNDIITGKRMWAHGPTGDVEPNAAPVVYWFRHTIDSNDRVRFEPHQIDDRSGVGVQICTKDVNNDGRVDILTASKLGTFLFTNNRSD